MRTVFSEKVRAVRASLGLQQDEFAHRLEISTQMVSAYENAKSMPSFKTLERLAEHAKQPVAWFFVDERQHRLVALADSEVTPREALEVLSGLVARWESDQATPENRAADAPAAPPQSRREKTIVPPRKKHGRGRPGQIESG